MSVNFDSNRRNETGIPEVILAGPKTKLDLEKAIKEACKLKHKVLITRIGKEQVELISELSESIDRQVRFDNYNRTCIISDDAEYNETGGKDQIALISGGTSDGPIVEEIKFCLQFFGHNPIIHQDIGVAGIHRHQDVLKSLEKMNSIKLIIVVAGAEGALFSVISAQTKIPVVAVPVSIGYGYGGKGEAALKSALQSCSPGIAVMNIDNGFGAAVFANKLMRLFE